MTVIWPENPDPSSGRRLKLTLPEFLLARIAEDEAVARERFDWDRPHAAGCSIMLPDHHGPECDCNMSARVLAECEAKRRIVENAERNRTDLMRQCDLYSWEARVLAAVYADHPDYREEWKP